MKLGLGTVQFGLDYGISNKDGMTSSDEVKKILEYCLDNNITILDTASIYGKSEEVLGQNINKKDYFKIVTKTSRFDNEILTHEDTKILESTFYDSLHKLKQNTVYGLLLKEGNIFKDNSQFLIDKLQTLKERQLVQKIGISVYKSDEVDKAIELFDTLDIIQIPINIFDHRLINTGHLKKLKKHNVEIHARSAFLQGLLLMKPDSLNPYFNPILDHILKYHKTLEEINVNPLQAALGFLNNIQEIDCIVAGVNNLNQLKEICLNIEKPYNTILNGFSITDESILDPSKWKL